MRCRTFLLTSTLTLTFDIDTWVSAVGILIFHSSTKHFILVAIPFFFVDSGSIYMIPTLAATSVFVRRRISVLLLLHRERMCGYGLYISQGVSHLAYAYRYK